MPTLKAFELIAMLKRFNQNFLSNPVMTAEWERTLQEIEKEHKKAFQFMDKLNFLTGDIVKRIKILLK